MRFIRTRPYVSGGGDERDPPPGHDHATGGNHGDDRGQAVVELALALPLVAVVLLGLAQVMVVSVRQVAVVHTARDAVRAASVSADPATAARLVVERSLPEAGVDTTTAEGAAGSATVTVTVTLTDPTDVALIGPLIPSVVLDSRATMALEPP